MMWKRIVGGLIVIWVGYSVYDYYRAGLHTRPEMPDGAFSISYKSGLRVILVNIPNERETRRYFGYRTEVPFYLEDAWATCLPPTDDEAREFKANRNDNPGERIEGICRIKVDDDVVIRGIVTSVPKL